MVDETTPEQPAAAPANPPAEPPPTKPKDPINKERDPGIGEMC